jgi:DNA/RNA endonuclease YhcR with UshA esterase domain
MLREKNICVKGIIEEYKGKAQIIVDDPDDIIIL